MDLEPEWEHLSEDENGIAMNSYFTEHPEMIVGKMEMVIGVFCLQQMNWYPLLPMKSMRLLCPMKADFRLSGRQRKPTASLRRAFPPMFGHPIPL